MRTPAGTTLDYVSVYNLPFSLDGTNPGVSGDGNVQIITPRVDTFRDVLLYVVVGLGVLLLILLVVTLFMGHSRKKKIRRRQEAAFAAAAQGGAAAGGRTHRSRNSPRKWTSTLQALPRKLRRNPVKQFSSAR